jgi:hypothetical protein
MPIGTNGNVHTGINFATQFMTGERNRTAAKPGCFFKESYPVLICQMEGGT